MTSKSSDCSSAAFTATESTGSAPGPPHRRWPARPRRRGARSRPRGARLLHPLQAGSRRGAGDAAVRGQRQRRGQAHSSQKRAEGFHLGGQQAGAGAAGGVGAKGGGTRRAALASHGGPGAAARPPGSRAFFSSTMRSITLPANRPWSRAIWPGVRTASVAPCRRRPAPGAGARKISRPVASQPRPARCSGTPGCTCAPPGVGRQHPAGRSAAHLPPLSAGCAAWSCPHTLLGRCPPPRPRRHTQPPGIGGGREARAGRCTGAHATCCLGTGGAPSPPPPAAWALCTHPPPQRTKVGRASGGPGPGEDISACQPPPPPLLRTCMCGCTASAQMAPMLRPRQEMLNIALLSAAGRAAGLLAKVRHHCGHGDRQDPRPVGARQAGRRAALCTAASTVGAAGHAAAAAARHSAAHSALTIPGCLANQVGVEHQPPEGRILHGSQQAKRALCPLGCGAGRGMGWGGWWGGGWPMGGRPTGGKQSRQRRAQAQAPLAQRSTGRQPGATHPPGLWSWRTGRASRAAGRGPCGAARARGDGA